MDKRAAAQYLQSIYGDGQGHVAVAYKDKGESWQEQTFSWPADKVKIVRWAEIHQDANIFICPALRSSPVRTKGDGTALRWLWADVDMDAVPDDRRGDVQARIKQLGTLVVASGSGDNRHVYVKLDREVSLTDHYRLNRGLRDYLYADAKHADNSLLRLPGTTNWKTDDGSPVKRVGGVVGPEVSPQALLKIRTFAKVPLSSAIGAVSEVDWTPVEMDDLPRRIRKMSSMATDEAVARYGSRHKAVWAVAGELHKRGLNGDEIHTLMDQFPPALDKNDEEHNGYDVHKDIEKRLIWDRANVPAMSEDSMAELEESVMEMDGVTEGDIQTEIDKEIEAWAELDFRRNLARKRARQLEAERSWVAPPVTVSWSLRDVLKRPVTPTPYLIGPTTPGGRGLAGAKHNVIITAQYKTGKTRFVISTIAKALCDAEDFMDAAPVFTNPEGMVVGHWNCEMDSGELAGEYVIPAGIENVHNFRGANLRGERVNLLSAQGKDWAIRWLRGEIEEVDEDGNPTGSFPPPVKVWTIDSLARLARMSGVSEKDNDEMFDLLMALDEIKVQADVDVLFLITHTGRVQHEEGKERARGATAIDDWCDARWIMTEDSGVRFLAVDGRGVGLDTTALVYDPDTGRSVLGFGGKAEAKADGAVQAVVDVVKRNPGIAQSALYKVLQAEPLKIGRRAATQYLEDAIDAGFVETRRDPRPGGGRALVKHFLVGSEPPEGDRNRRATPQEVDMRGVRRRVRR